MRPLLCLLALVVLVPIAAAADASKVTIGTRVGLVGATPGSVWAPDQTSRGNARQLCLSHCYD